MARIRSIKPEFWTSAQVMSCQPLTRLLFIGMWNFADDYGRMPYAPATIKAQVLPGDTIELQIIRDMLVELSSAGLILIYSAKGREYLEITGWAHQKIDKPHKPKHPCPVAEETENLAEPSPNIPRTLVAGEERIREDKKGKEETSPCSVDDVSRETTTTSPSDSPLGAAEKYVFESGVIRLSEKDFNQWREAYGSLDLRAELLSLRQWAGDQGASWFYAVSSALAKRNREQKVKLEQARSAGKGYVSATPGII